MSRRDATRPTPQLQGISDYTRDICRLLCGERAVEMEIARLDAKLAAMTDHGQLTPAEAMRDTERKADAARLFRIARGE